MKRFWLLALVVFLPTAVLALNQTDSPPKFPLAWGANAGGSYIRSIPSASQIGTQNCAASLNDGFPPLTFVAAGAGGCPPFGQDFNGALKQITQGIQWYQAGGPIKYDAAFASAIGGYPSYATVLSAVVAGTRWISQVDNNLTNPDAGGAGWIQDPSQIPIGTPIQSLSSVVPFGYVAANGKTIGDASSNATGLASPITQFLFAFLWTNCSSALCPIYTSGGSASSRGANAAADYAAHKALAVTNMVALGLMGAETMGNVVTTYLNGVPVIAGATNTPGSYIGENLHALVAAENGTHTHVNSLTDPGHVHVNSLTDPGHTHASNANITGTVGAQSGGGFNAPPTGPATIGSSPSNVTINNASAPTGVSINNAASGSSTPHNTVERSMIVYWILKL